MKQTNKQTKQGMCAWQRWKQFYSLHLVVYKHWYLLLFFKFTFNNSGYGSKRVYVNPGLVFTADLELIESIDQHQEGQLA